MEYCSSVWDPHQSTLISGLESVQKFAGRVVTQDWKFGLLLSLCLSLGWQNLRARRKKQKLKVCYMILSVLPSFHFTPNPHPSPRHPHSKTLFLPYARTNSHKFSFLLTLFISGIPFLHLLLTVSHLTLLSVSLWTLYFLTPHNSFPHSPFCCLLFFVFLYFALLCFPCLPVFTLSMLNNSCVCFGEVFIVASG